MFFRLAKQIDNLTFNKMNDNKFNDINIIDYNNVFNSIRPFNASVIKNITAAKLHPSGHIFLITENILHLFMLGPSLSSPCSYVGRTLLDFDIDPNSIYFLNHNDTMIITHGTIFFIYHRLNELLSTKNSVISPQFVVGIEGLRDSETIAHIFEDELQDLYIVSSKSRLYRKTSKSPSVYTFSCVVSGDELKTGGLIKAGLVRLRNTIAGVDHAIDNDSSYDALGVFYVDYKLYIIRRYNTLVIELGSSLSMKKFVYGVNWIANRAVLYKNTPYILLNRTEDSGALSQSDDGYLYKIITCEDDSREFPSSALFTLPQTLRDFSFIVLSGQALIITKSKVTSIPVFNDSVTDLTDLSTFEVGVDFSSVLSVSNIPQMTFLSKLALRESDCLLLRSDSFSILSFHLPTNSGLRDIEIIKEKFARMSCGEIENHLMTCLESAEHDEPLKIGGVAFFDPVKFTEVFKRIYENLAKKNMIQTTSHFFSLIQSLKLTYNLNNETLFSVLRSFEKDVLFKVVDEFGVFEDEDLLPFSFPLRQVVLKDKDLILVTIEELVNNEKLHPQNSNLLTDLVNTSEFLLDCFNELFELSLTPIYKMNHKFTPLVKKTKFTSLIKNHLKLCVDLINSQKSTYEWPLRTVQLDKLVHLIACLLSATLENGQEVDDYVIDLVKKMSPEDSDKFLSTLKSKAFIEQYCSCLYSKYGAECVTYMDSKLLARCATQLCSMAVKLQDQNFVQLLYNIDSCRDILVKEGEFVAWITGDKDAIEAAYQMSKSDDDLIVPLYRLMKGVDE